MSLAASVLALKYQGSDAAIPEPLEAIFFPMKFVQKMVLSTQLEDDEAYLLHFIAKHLNSMLLFGFALFVCWLGVHGTRSSNCSLELFKAIMTVWFIACLLGAFFTVYSWTLMPIFEELLPRCDAVAVCMPQGQDTAPSIIQSCINRDGKPALPAECAWTADHFLGSCTKPVSPPMLTAGPMDFAGIDLNGADDSTFDLANGDEEMMSILIMDRRRLEATTDIVCQINRPLMEEYHGFIENFSFYLARATLCFWTILLVLILNAVSSSSCIYVACKFQHLQQHSKRRVARDVSLRGPAESRRGGAHALLRQKLAADMQAEIEKEGEATTQNEPMKKAPLLNQETQSVLV